MPTLAEMTTWSLEDIQREIHSLLPEGWKFGWRQEEGVAWFESDSGLIPWECTEIVPETLLLNAYGFLWRRTQKPGHPAWGSRTSRILVPVGGVSLLGIGVPDPEDLDPAEILAVYGASKP